MLIGGTTIAGAGRRPQRAARLNAEGDTDEARAIRGFARGSLRLGLDHAVCERGVPMIANG
jgi:hypothetical protein